MHPQVKIIPNVLTREQCAEIIASAPTFERDYLKGDTARQSKYSDRETLENNTREWSLQDSYGVRKVSQAPLNDPVFSEWDGLPVYRCKIMRYETGDFLNEHWDAQWMCLSNYWVPNTNRVSQSLMSMALNDDYTGGEFTVDGEVIPQEVGSVVQVPCDGLNKTISARHGVREVTSGTRYALVFWNFA